MWALYDRPTFWTVLTYAPENFTIGFILSCRLKIGCHSKRGFRLKVLRVLKVLILGKRSVKLAELQAPGSDAVSWTRIGSWVLIASCNPSTPNSVATWYRLKRKVIGCCYYGTAWISDVLFVARWLVALTSERTLLYLTLDCTSAQQRKCREVGGRVRSLSTSSGR